MIMVVTLPIIVFGVYMMMPFKTDKGILPLIVIFFIAAILGLAGGTTTFLSVVLSCILLLPMLFLLFSHPQKKYLQQWPNSLTKPFIVVLVIIDSLGFLFWLRYGGDEFGLAYGRHYEYVHGLAMINTFMLLWYLMKYFYGQMKLRDWFLGGFFTASWLCCSFGLGFLCLLLTFVILLLLARKFKVLLLLASLLAGAYLLLQTSTFDYERENIIKAQEKTDARKITMFEDFLKLTIHDPQMMFIGTGPGGYNSRTSFLLSGENNNIINRWFDRIEPPYYKKYIYPLWNNTFVSQEEYTDGTRNKPYSNLVSLWAENGIFFLLLFIWMYGRQLARLHAYKNFIVEYHYLIALDIFMIISLISHIWLESSEFLIYCILRSVLLADMRQRRINAHLKQQL